MIVRHILIPLLLSLHITAERGAATATKNTFRVIPHSLTSTKAAQSGKLGPELICPSQLETAVEAITGRASFRRYRWGILIQTLSSAQILYSHDAKNYFVPASNLKLFTTAAALHQLGPQFRIRTSVYGRKDGQVRVVGRGDPSLTNAQLRQLARQLRRQRYRVKQLVAQDDYFQGDTVNPSWEWEDVQVDYGAPINSLILNQNAVTFTLSPQAVGKPLQVIWADPAEAASWRIENDAVTVKPDEPAFIGVSRDLGGPVLHIKGQLGLGSQPEPVGLAVINPTDYFLRHFRQALADEGILAASSTDTAAGTQGGSGSLAMPELASVESPPLSQLLVETNQNSNNLYAEALLRILGVRSAEFGVQSSEFKVRTLGSAEMGLAVVKATLTKLGIDPTGYVLVDGSGLSRQNLVSPEAIVQTLTAMAQSPEANVYRASLSVAGLSGTLQNRFRDSAAQGIVQAKTGSMSGVMALSGYIQPSGYQPLVFSIIVNQSDQSAAALRQAVDEVVLVLAQLHRC